ncbi:bifunctional adenosylcobinamide kinase/adenosylcobinamide-phosphate guanylyltransferase [Blautia glucerasea]
MMILVTGGSGSGKSAFAEDCVLACGEKKRIYIATMYPFDQESKKRVLRHRKMRAGKGFDTEECYVGLKNVQIPSGCTVLLECMSNLTANEIFREDGAGEKTEDEILQGVESLKNQAEDLIIVTNEIFSEADTYEEETENYRSVLGNINRRLARMADTVVEVVYGIPVYYKKGEDFCEKSVEQF